MIITGLFMHMVITGKSFLDCLYLICIFFSLSFILVIFCPSLLMLVRKKYSVALERKSCVGTYVSSETHIDASLTVTKRL